MLQTSFKASMLEAFRSRMYFYSTVVAVFFIIIIIQIINLQFIRGEEFSLKAKNNMENYVPIFAARGDIYDRNFDLEKGGHVLASNRASFNITTIPGKFKSKSKLRRIVRELEILLGLKEKIEIKYNRNNQWERIILVEDNSFKSIVKLASHQHRFPNIDWEDSPVRVYNHGNELLHAIGYIGSINKKEYKQLKNKGYKYYQNIGKSGIEKKYDKILRGNDGFVRKIVDVRRRTEGEEVGLNPISGNNIFLTIDYDVQKVAFDALGDLNGAVVVLKPSTGEIISLISKPDFDPNLIISKKNSGLMKELLSHKNKPFLNRSIQAKYPPASIFKLVTAIAALETEKSYPDKSFFCSGKYTLKGYRNKDFYCFARHGKLDLRWAIAKSCSVYFYQLGYMIGPTPIIKYAGYLGLNEKTGIDLTGEVAGFVPSKKYKLKVYNQSWFDGDTLNLSIGQGFLNVTLIGMVNMVSAIVNSGIVYKPQLVKEIRSPDNKVLIRKFKKERLRETPLSPTTIKTIKDGMRLGVTGGTQMYLNNLKVKVAGKTGTAQTRSVRKDNLSQHAWYIGYAPFNGNNDDAIVVGVFIEYGMWGAAKAVPVAKKIFNKMDNLGYFPKK